MEKITILGAGLVGSLLSIYLSKHGHAVEVYERRGDPRVGEPEIGRSINLALSDRGFKGLAGASKALAEEVRRKSIPMKGRMVHDEHGKQTLQPYGKEGQYIYSISRRLLNQVLISFAEEAGVKFQFNQRCVEADLVGDRLTFEDTLSQTQASIHPELVFGADGAFSALRYAMQKTDLFNYSQEYLEYGYKELSIPAINGMHQMEKGALHIWPRKSFMLIALPNLDGSFTCTLFLPFKGDKSFQTLSSETEVRAFFSDYFPDTLALVPELTKAFFTNPTSSLVTVKCFPWLVKDKYALIGDAAHAIVPFYGQGLNAGFEDCSVLDQLLEKGQQDLKKVLGIFQKSRKDDTDAIAKLALRNFTEMRDLVINETFLLRKKIEARLHELYPSDWIPLYTMVTFSDMPYAKALKLCRIQDNIMEEVLDMSGIETSWKNLDFEAVIKKYKNAQTVF